MAAFRYDDPSELEERFSVPASNKLLMYRINQCADDVHKGKACQNAMYRWWVCGENISGAEILIKMEGRMYPSVIDSGRIFRSSVGTNSRLLAFFPDSDLAMGDVRRCRAKYNGTTTVKATFWTRIPIVPMKLTNLPLFPNLILSIMSKVHAAPNCPNPKMQKSVNLLLGESTTGAKKVIRTRS